MDGVLLNVIFNDDEKLNKFDTLLEYLSLSMHEGDRKDSEDLQVAISKIECSKTREVTKKIIEHDWFWNFDPEYGQGEDDESEMPMIELVFGVFPNSKEFSLLKEWLITFGAEKVKAEETEFFGEFEE